MRSTAATCAGRAPGRLLLGINQVKPRANSVDSALILISREADGERLGLVASYVRLM